MRRPNQYPRAITPTTETMVKSIPSFPLCSDSNRFMPKPSPTTANWSRYLEAFEDCFIKGFPTVKPKRSPMKRAIAGLTNGRKHAAIPMKNSGLLKLLFIIDAFYVTAACSCENELAKLHKKDCVVET